MFAMRSPYLFAGAFAMSLGLLANGAAAEAARGMLRDVSLRVVDVFNARDGAALRAMLTPEQHEREEADELVVRLAECHRRFGPLERISLPVMATRSYGLMAAHFETAVRDLFLEIDADGGIKVLTIVGADGSCSLAGPRQADR
jgi:hypothetical protein